jgi:putative ABC transport system permease protein
MPQIDQFLRRIIFLFSRKRMERELAEEMRFHAQRKAEKNLDKGMDSAEAHYAVRRQLGNVTLQQEESRRSWGFPRLESVIQDLRYGARGLRNSPGFTLVALLTLALGIGATTAIFSIVYAVVLRPLPYKDSRRIVNISTVSSMFPEFTLGQSIPNLNDIKARAKSLETIATYQRTSLVLTGTGEPEQISVAAVSPNFLDVFGAHPMLGRAFLPGDEQQKNGNLVLLGYRLWQKRFGSDPQIVGKRINLDQKPYTVVGVLPQTVSSFYLRGYGKTDAIVPLVVPPDQAKNRTGWMYLAIAKLRSGVSLARAQAELDAIAGALAHEYPKDASQIKFPVETIQDTTVGGDKRELMILLAAVGFLLLIACANVSNLVLSRGLQRQREIAVRAALGASRTRVARQLLLESLLLAVTGGAAGLGLAVWGIQAFHALAPVDFPRLDELRLEPHVAFFAFMISVLAAVVFGLAPAISASRSDLTSTMKENSATASTRQPFLRSALVVTEVALALVLLTGSALMVQSMMRTLRVDPGLRTDHMVTAEVTLSTTRYPSEEAQLLFTRKLLDALRAQPQFSGVALSNNSILAHSTALTTFDPATLGSNEKETNLEARWTSPGFFSTMGIPVLRGREFSDQDQKGAPNVIIINESMAQRFFPRHDAVGRSFKFSLHDKDSYQIVGIVADTRDIQLNAKPRPEIYFPVLQVGGNELRIMVHSSLDPAAVSGLLRNALRSVDKDEPLREVRTMTEVIASSIADHRFRTWLLSAFAFAGLILTLIGIYGVISYSVAQRTHEMGIRIALGARPGKMLLMVLGHALQMAVAGAAIGIAGAFLLMRVLANQLYEIKSSDPVTFIGAAIAMLLVSTGASYLPARRATRVDPMVALRCE